uniref:Photosystem I assembly protein Ycf4 n=2 Tax=Euglena gracilis TaxID=3039 RepID=YCF4_EUGGR|nr:RecName: Full=Photosystem I assembly protein Ycf4 [Euglena gracilis]
MTLSKNENIKAKQKQINLPKILRQEIKENNKIIKWFYNIVMLLGGIGFLIVGISSYIGNNLIYFLDASEIIFFPQGITMCFYGTCGILFSINQISIILNGVGEGYNEFNKELNLMTIYRKGKQGKNSDINITYSLKDIEGIRIEIKNEYFNVKQNVFLRIKDKNDLPIIQLSNPIKISDLEKQASEIASFLNVPIKGY